MSLKNFSKNDVEIVVYHKNCNDGVASAAIAYKYAKHIEFIPMNAGTLPDEVNKIVSKNILFLDVSPTKEEFLYLMQKNNVLVIDHHVSAMKALDSIPDICKIFDMTHSASYLSMEYFYPDIDIYDESSMKEFVKLIEDYDLWTKKYEPKATNLFRGICFYLNDNEDSNSKIPVFADYMNDFQFLIEKGIVLTEIEDKYIMDIYSKGTLCHYKDLKCYVMCVDTYRSISNIGEMGCQDDSIDFSFTYYLNKDVCRDTQDFYKCSLRSNRNGKNTDVSLIAKEFGGGGHHNASGFSIKIHPRTLFE